MSRRHRELGLRRGRGCAESLYSMINLDRVQDGLPLRLTHPTPCHGRFNRRRWQMLGASVSPQDRNL